MDAERLGPAFDSNILRQPTGRKLAGCWMEYAGLRTLVQETLRRRLCEDVVIDLRQVSTRAA